MNKKRLYIFSATLTIVSIVALAIGSEIYNYNTQYWWTMLVSGIFFIIFFALTCVVYFPNAEFICSKCNKQFKPTKTACVFAIHFPTKRLLRCPHCNELSWAKETWNFENK